MPSILNLKFKGNKSFVAFSNLSDTESLTKTWKVCTKVASYLEQGQRLENLSWRLWHLQNLMVDTDNAKSKREFKKLSKCMGDKLDKEKGRAIEELEAPDFRHNHSTELIRQRAAEKEKLRDATHSGTIKRMQFTFSVDQPMSPASSQHVRKPDTKPSAEFAKRSRAQATPRGTVDNVAGTDTSPSPNPVPSNPSLHFPPLFSNDFGPSALLYAQPTLTTPMNYGEGLNPSTNNDSFSISRPTIELPLDDILFGDDSPIPAWNSSELPKETADQQDVLMQPPPPPATLSESPLAAPTAPLPSPTPPPATDSEQVSTDADVHMDDDMPSPAPSTIKRLSASAIFKNIPSAKEPIPETVAPSKVNQLYANTNTRSSTPTGRPTLTVRTQSVTTRSAGPGATATSLSAAGIRSGSSSGSGSLAGGSSGSGNSAPGGVKAECSNCGATHTPLWRRGLNDELNCNACGLYCKLHKRPRPKSMRNSHGEGRAQASARQDPVDPVPDLPTSVQPTTTTSTHRSSSHSSSNANTSSSGGATTSSQSANVTAQCYNCHTTATPLWRKDDEGKTVCNACGLYYKLHGSARPISMKSDVIRKRSRHDARRSISGSNSHHHTHSSVSNTHHSTTTTTIHEDTSSVSPAASQRNSPVRDASPTLAPDSTTQISYDYPSAEDEATLMGALSSLSSVVGSGSSELMGALGAGAMGVSSHSSHGHSHLSAQGTVGGQGLDGTQSSNPFGLAFYPGPYHPDYLMQFYGLSPDVLPFALETGSVSSTTTTTSAADSSTSSTHNEDAPSSSSSSVRAMSPRSNHTPPSPSASSLDLDLEGGEEEDPAMSPRSSKRRRMSTDSMSAGSEPPLSAVSYSSFGSISSNGGWGLGGALGNGLGPHSHSLSHSGHSHSHSLSHTHGHSHSLSVSHASTQHHGHSHPHGHAHGHGHHKRASLDFPFTTYNTNGTINNGPALRGSENTFWHPPMMPLPVSNSPRVSGVSLGANGNGERREKEHSPSRSPVLSGSGSGSGSPNLRNQTPASSSASSTSPASSASSASSSSSASLATTASSSPSLKNAQAMVVGMDYLQHVNGVDGMLEGVVVGDEDSLFNAFLHHPMDGVVSTGSGGSSGKATGSVVL